MCELDQMVHVLDSVSEENLSPYEARERIKEIAETARVKYPEHSAGWRNANRIAEKSNGYLNSIEAHPEESRRKCNPALEAIKLTVERIKLLSGNDVP